MILKNMKKIVKNQKKKLKIKKNYSKEGIKLNDSLKKRKC